MPSITSLLVRYIIWSLNIDKMKEGRPHRISPHSDLADFVKRYFRFFGCPSIEMNSTTIPEHLVYVLRCLLFKCVDIRLKFSAMSVYLCLQVDEMPLDIHVAE